jgi:hypothetical protein
MLVPSSDGGTNVLDEMASQIERAPGRSFVDPDRTWAAREQSERPSGGRLEMPGGARLVGVAVATLAVLAPWLI